MDIAACYITSPIHWGKKILSRAYALGICRHVTGSYTQIKKINKLTMPEEGDDSKKQQTFFRASRTYEKVLELHRCKYRQHEGCHF
jgi:tRNA U34 2-thiouridine synthase MnmA/TrmU